MVRSPRPGVIAGLVVTAFLYSPAAQADSVPAATSARATLTISASTAQVGVDVPFTAAVTPAATAAGRGLRLQVRNRAGVWQSIDGWRLGRTGIIRDTVTGLEPGVGRYRVLVLDRSTVVATSNVAAVTWTAPSSG